jgi:hypothetical protein
MKYDGFSSLLGTSHKITLSDRWSTEYLSTIMYLKPFQTIVDGVLRQICPDAQKNRCYEPCLNISGHGGMAPVQRVRQARTEMFWRDRPQFLAILDKGIQKHIRKANKLGKKAVIRLNGTSDIAWETMGIFEKYPTVQFMDYTKSFKRMRRYLSGDIPNVNPPHNFHLTFSRGAGNDDEAAEVLRLGGNVAIVFRTTLPARLGFPANTPPWEPKRRTVYTVGGVEYPVIDGTKHDLRFTDPPLYPVIVGLLALAKAKKDYSGFVIDLEEGE